LLGLLVEGVRGLEKRNEDAVFEGEGGSFVAGRHIRNIVVVTITVKRKIDRPDSGFAHRPQLDFTQEALRTLGNNHGDGVGNIVGS
jgi:hypothetical protein